MRRIWQTKLGDDSEQLVAECGVWLASELSDEQRHNRRISFNEGMERIVAVAVSQLGEVMLHKLG
jgi:hypothetical protein